MDAKFSVVKEANLVPRAVASNGDVDRELFGDTWSWGAPAPAAWPLEFLTLARLFYYLKEISKNKVSKN